MSETEFWQLVTTSDYSLSAEEVCAQLRSKLEPLDNTALAAFDKSFSQKMRLSYRWDLYAAAYIIAGCNSEYAFAEFRSWLISRGQDIFENALLQPDDIADFNIMSYQEDRPYPYLEEYDLIAGLIYEERCGQELPFVPSGQDQPKGKPFKDKTKYFRTHYPKLFKRYWVGMN